MAPNFASAFCLNWTDINLVVYIIISKARTKKKKTESYRKRANKMNDQKRKVGKGNKVTKPEGTTKKQL